MTHIGKAMADLPFWSVIVPTYQREQVLCDTIQYLLGLTYPCYELLVIDQTPQHSAETELFFHTCKTQYPQRFRRRFVSEASLPHARNVGAEMARGDYLLYCDDDIVPPADLIELHLRNVTQPGIGAATGGVSNERTKLAAAAPSSGALTRPVKPCTVLPSGRLLQNWDYDLPKGITDSLRGGNMSMRRQLAVEVGLFDKGYIGRANGEETDFSLRILRRGYQIAYDPAAAVVHLAHPAGGARASQAIDEGRYYFESHYNNAYFFAKNFQQRYLPWLLKREVGWIVVKQGLLQKHPAWIIPSLRGLWHGYWAGLRKRKQ